MPADACNCLQSACKIQKWQVRAPTARRGGSGQWRTALRFSRKSHRLLLSRRQISSKSHRRFQSHRRISVQCHRLSSLSVPSFSVPPSDFHPSNPISLLSHRQISIESSRLFLPTTSRVLVGYAYRCPPFHIAQWHDGQTKLVGPVGQIWRYYAIMLRCWSCSCWSCSCSFCSWHRPHQQQKNEREEDGGEAERKKEEDQQQPNKISQRVDPSRILPCIPWLVYPSASAHRMLARSVGNYQVLCNPDSLAVTYILQ